MLHVVMLHLVVLYLNALHYTLLHFDVLRLLTAYLCCVASPMGSGLCFSLARVQQTCI